MKLEIDSLREHGFSGFVPIRGLQADTQRIPDSHGVYVVIRDSASDPTFLEKSRAGWYQGKNPSYPIRQLREKWVPAALVVYVGKAGPSRRRTLRVRISEFIEFGSGKPVPHRGGRAVWQLADSSGLLVAWKRVSTLSPREMEKRLLSEFQSQHGCFPFANFQG